MENLGENVGAGNLYEKNVTTGEETKYYYAEGRRIALRKGGNLYYILSDHLGGTVSVVNPDGSQPNNSAYYSLDAPRLSTAGFGWALRSLRLDALN